MYLTIDLKNPAIRRRRRAIELLKEAESRLRYYQNHLTEFNRDNWNVQPESPELLAQYRKNIDRALEFVIKWQALPWEGGESRHEIRSFLRWLIDSWHHRMPLMTPLGAAVCILNESYPFPLIDQLELLFAMLRYPGRTTIDI